MCFVQGLLFWFLQLYQLQMLHTQLQIQANTMIWLQRPWKTDFPLPDVSTLFSLVLDGIILFQCFQKRDKSNFMQLNNTDAFNWNYYSREAEIYFFLLTDPFHYSFFCTGFYTCFHSSCVNIRNKTKLLCVLLHVLSKHDIFCCNTDLKIKKAQLYLCA